MAKSIDANAKNRELQATVSFLSSKRALLEGELDRTRALFQIRTNELKVALDKAAKLEGEKAALVSELNDTKSQLKYKTERYSVLEKAFWERDDQNYKRGNWLRFLITLLVASVGALAIEHLRFI